ncbi:hypothetical protein [Thalassoroseus pseudoceratinae]|uniref:hypothetical protein n=1 Tax=Thalassoroseus pseudoceratinae TaxID=2713176 RepID=UPI00141EC28F|nr:hypothetical protein [Thalassoroseus pseudoceratinae]
MPSIPNNYSSPSIFPTVRGFVQIRQNWADDWQYVQYLQPIRCEEMAAPNVGTAQLKYDFGSIKRENASSFVTYLPEELRDYYVRILVQNGSNELVPIFVGVIVDDETEYLTNSSLSGTQTVTAYDLKYLLERERLDKAYVTQDDEVYTLDWCPEFNRRVGRHQSRIQGNASEEPTLEETEPGDVKTFGGPGFFNTYTGWTAADVIWYVLEYFTPDELTFRLADIKNSQDEFVLSKKIEVWNFAGATPLDVLNRLIDRKQGLGWKLRINSDDEIEIQVFSILDIPFNLGGIEIPANEYQTDLALADSFPATHLLDNLNFNVTNSNKYDEILVRGERIQVMATFSVEDDMTAGWGDDDEADYKTGSQGDNPTTNDEMRSASKYEDIFSKFVLPDDWNGTIGENAENILPNPGDDGSVSFDSTNEDGEEVTLHWWRHNKIFMRNLFVGEDGNDEGELLPLLAFVADTEDGALHEATDKTYRADKMSKSNEYLKDISVEPLDTQLGVRFKVTPNHYIALGNWEYEPAENADPEVSYAYSTTVEPELDYNKFTVTAAFETDKRQQIKVGNSENPKRRLVIDVPDCHYWYASAAAIYKTDEDGNGVTVEDQVIRDDVNKLKAVAVAAAAWFSRERQAVQIPIKSLGIYLPVGCLVNGISGFNLRESVKTVVTARQLDFQNNQTLIRTAYDEIDFVGVI